MLFDIKMQSLDVKNVKPRLLKVYLSACVCGKNHVLMCIHVLVCVSS